MEHQSAVTTAILSEWLSRGDVSFTGIGYKFDFIIVHESGHNGSATISEKDAADMWIHEGSRTFRESYRRILLGKDREPTTYRESQEHLERWPDHCTYGATVKVPANMDYKAAQYCIRSAGGQR